MSGRRLGAALALGVVLALVFDLLLQSAVSAVRIGASGVNWEAAVVTKAVWLVAIAVAAAIAPALLSVARNPLEWPEAVRIAGLLLIATPLIWTASALLVFVTEVPLTQPAFYAQLVTTNGPWLLAGAALRAASRHVEVRG
jgi:hypothetical protein